jgi:8-oxo-dGTP pyrophosphatase MutT (NUDIX family)
VWTSFGEQTIYACRWLRLDVVDVEAPGGDRFDYHVVRLDRIALAILLNAADEVLMLWRYRFPIDRWGYELPGGLVEDGETPTAAAARETLEESGWAPAGKPARLIGFEPLPGNVTAPMEVFVWRTFERAGEPSDPARVDWVPLSRVWSSSPGGVRCSARPLWRRCSARPLWRRCSTYGRR